MFVLWSCWLLMLCLWCGVCCRSVVSFFLRVLVGFGLLLLMCGLMVFCGVCWIWVFLWRVFGLLGLVFFRLCVVVGMVSFILVFWNWWRVVLLFRWRFIFRFWSRFR